MKFIGFLTVSNLFTLEVIQKCQHSQLCVLRENSSTTLFAVGLNSAKVWNRGFNLLVFGVRVHNKSPNVWNALYLLNIFRALPEYLESDDFIKNISFTINTKKKFAGVTSSISTKELRLKHLESQNQLFDDNHHTCIKIKGTQFSAHQIPVVIKRELVNLTMTKMTVSWIKFCRNHELVVSS